MWCLKLDAIGLGDGGQLPSRPVRAHSLLVTGLHENQLSIAPELAGAVDVLGKPKVFAILQDFLTGDALGAVLLLSHLKSSLPLSLN